MKHTIFFFVALIIIATSCKKQVQDPNLQVGADQTESAQVWEMAPPSPPTPYPDIVITYLYVSPVTIDHRDGQEPNRFRYIKYTIKNIGTKEVSLNSIKMQGFRGTYNSNGSITYLAGCGTLARQLGPNLLPGESYTDDYTCNGGTQSGDIYKLFADYDNTVRELNENNNTKVISMP